MTDRSERLLADGRYRVIRRIGSGGMGVVYEAEDRERGQRVALKTVRDPSPDKIYRFKREFRVLAELSHPNLIALHELFVGDECFFTMELLDGTDFISFVTGDWAGSSTPRREGDSAPGGAEALATDDTPQVALACDEIRLRRVLPQLARGLIALHEAAVVHRDIKPSNIVVTRKGRLVLLDFGLLAQAEARQTPSQEGHVVGTVKYMAPEQCCGDPATPAADWYGFGVVLYEALTGRAPFQGRHTAILIDKQRYDPAPPRAIVPSVPRDLDGLCVDLLSRSANDRPSGPAVLSRLGVSAHAGGQDGAPNPQPSATQGVPLTGREEELATLARCFKATEAGRAAVVLIRGESGIGKSALTRAFIARVAAEHDDLVTLEGRCYERETIAYQAMDSLVDNLSRYWRRLEASRAAELLPLEASVLPRLFPVLGRVPAVASAPRGRVIADPQELRTRAFAALRELMHRLVLRHHLILFLDDMQWVDAHTLDLLSDLMRPPDSPGLFLILSSRPEGMPALERLIGDTQIETTATVALEPLAEDTAVALAARLLGPEDARLADRVAIEASGNPFFIGQLAHFLRTVDSAQVGEIGLDELLAQRIAGLSATARRVLELVAVAGEPITRRVLARGAELDPADLTREVGVLRTLNFLVSRGMRMTDEVEVFHDRVRDAVGASLSASARSAHHRALALAFEEWNDASDEQLARYWHGAGDDERATEHAHRAADQALARLGFDRAAELYRMALDLGSYDRDQERELHTALGNALAQAGRSNEAARVFTLAAADADDAVRLELHRRSAEELLRGGYLEEGLGKIHDVLQTIGRRLASTPTRALLSVIARRVILRLRGLRWRIRDTSKVSRHDLARVDIFWTVASGLGYVDTMRGAEYQARHFTLALRVGEPRRMVQAFVAEACYQAALGGVRRAERAAGVGLEVARAIDSPYVEALALWGPAFINYQAKNDWRASLEGFTTSAALLRAHSQAGGWELDTIELHSLFNKMQLGEMRDLARLVPAYIREAQRRGDRYFEVNLRTRLNLMWLVKDDAEGARRDLEAAIGSWMPALKTFQVQHYWGLYSGCERELYIGDAAAAAALVDAALPLLRRSLLLRVVFIKAEVLYTRGRIALACGAAAPQPARARYAREAQRYAGKLRRASLPLARAFAPLLEAGVANLRGEEERAVTELRRALEILEKLDTMLFASAARRRLGEVIAGDEGAALVVEAERWMQSQGVENPARMTAMVIPGWPHPG